MARVFDLDQYRDLFCDERSFRKLSDALQSSCQNGFCPIVIEKRVIGSIMSAPFTKKMLVDRLVQKAIRQPELLYELAERLGSDEGDSNESELRDTSP